MRSGRGAGEVREPEERLQRLRRLWQEHQHDPFPAADTLDPRLQEVALYESWLGGIVEAALARGGRLSAAHRRLIEVRVAETEGRRALWSLAAELGDPVRPYVARLLAIQDTLAALPDER
jgi:hypothetical protein